MPDTKGPTSLSRSSAQNFRRTNAATDSSCSVETLRAQFEEKTIVPLGPNNAARAGRGFHELGIYAGFAQGVSAYQARYSAAHNQSWRVSRHGIWQFLSASECFRKQRFGVEMLFFQIGIKNHRQVADKDAP